MRVAIVGAGISGLACAHELERLGINPVIFERRFTVGDFHQHSGVILGIFTRPIRDLFRYIEDNYDITLFPLNNVNEITVYGPGRKIVARGEGLGYTFLKGQDENSIENQLRRLVKSKINFNIHADYRVLSKEYDYVVVASGNHLISSDIGIWRMTMHTFIKGAVILGNFNPQAMHMWFNTRFAGSGYGYMIPFDNKRATLGLVVPHISQSDIDEHWDFFLKTIKLDNPIVETFEQDLAVGHCTSHIIDNMYFVGNAAGLLNPLLCFGTITSLLSGIYAARAIVQKKGYEDMLKPLVNQIVDLTTFRNYIDKLDDRGFDKIIRLLSVPGVKQMFYNSNVDVWRLGARLLGLRKTIRD